MPPISVKKKFIRSVVIGWGSIVFALPCCNLGGGQNEACKPECGRALMCLSRLDKLYNENSSRFFIFIHGILID